MSRIEWCDITINPIVGCSKISEGCQNCYAEKMAYRLKCMGIPKYQDVVDKNGWTGKIGVDLTVFDDLPKIQKKIFVCSMGDLFHENVKDDLIYSILGDASSTYYGYHDYLFLTKRIERVKNIKFPQYRNLWLGVTTETQERANERIPILLQIPAAVRFVSVEPCLSKIDLEKYLLHCADCGNRGSTAYVKQEDNLCQKVCIKQGEGPALDWCIAGPETGPKARPCKPEWIEDLYQQCQEAGVPFFDKRKTGWIARESPK